MSSWNNDFPILKTSIHGKPLVYLDTAASAQKPQCVLDAIMQCYSSEYANVHRGLHTLSERLTDAFESVRDQVVDFLGASSYREIIFTSGATESINLVAQCFSAIMLKPGDEIIVTAMEHHANFVPWQVVCKQYGASLKVAPLTDNGHIDVDALEKLFSKNTRLFAFSHASNVLGTVNDAQALTKLAHAHHVAVLIDGAQAVVHQPVNVTDIDCDFYVFSSHKLYGPTGVGVLYGKEHWLDKMPAYQYGGEMIDYVGDESSTYAPLPHKFEAGTPNIASIIGFGEALRYMSSLDADALSLHETNVTKQLYDGLKAIDGVTIYGPPPKERVSLVAFSVDGVHVHDIGTLLDRRGIAVRVGHHCAQPLMRHLGVTATLRASLGLYSQPSDVQSLLDALPKIIAMIRGEP